MFNMLQEWLTSKLGTNHCLNYSNIGEKFKDGVLFARLLQKYQVIPDNYVLNFKRSDFYAVCLNNIKNINIWLQFLDIVLEDCIIHEIACGKSLSVVNVLYQLYYKLQNIKHNQILNNTNFKVNTETNNNNNVVDLYKSNSIKNNFWHKENKKHKWKEPISNYKKFNFLKLFCNLEGVQYTAIDIIKLTKNSTKQNNILACIQHNMNSFYDLFIKNLNDELYKNDLNEKLNKNHRNLLNIQYIKDEVTATTNKLNNNNLQEISDPCLKINASDKNINNLQLNNNLDKNGQNCNYTSNNLLPVTQDLINKSSTLNSLEIAESIISQSLDEEEYIHSEKQDFSNEYIHHTGLWSSEYLNIDQHECKQNILSVILNKVLNFECNKNKISFIEIKKKHIAGVVDKLQNENMKQLLIENLLNNGILGFTADEAVSACLNAYKKETIISTNKGKLYQVLEEHKSPQIITKKQTNNQKLRNNSNTIVNGMYSDI